MKKLTKKEYQTSVFLTILIPLLLLSYLWATNFIETEKLYPSEKDCFTFSSWGYVDNPDCFKIEPLYINYKNRIDDIKKFIDAPNVILVELDVYKALDCNHGESWISFQATNLSFPIIFDNSSDNLSSIYFNQTSNNSFTIHFNYSSNDHGNKNIIFYLPINKNFYNYYRFSPSQEISLMMIDFDYRNDVRYGYYADENSFFTLEGNITKDEPIFKGKYKRFWVGDNSGTLIRFNPKSKWWFLLQKILDTLVLGIIAVAIYDFPWSKSKHIPKKLFKDINHLFKMENAKIKEAKLTIKDFLQENSLNLVALSVFLLVTITLSSHQGALSHPLGILSAGISYFLIIDLIKRDMGKESMNLGIIKSFIIFFAILFCVWVILNLIIPASNWRENIILILWLIFILGVPVKLWSGQR